MRHPQLEAVEEVFRQTVPVLRQTLSVLKHGLHAEPTHGVKGGKKELSYPYRDKRLRCHSSDSTDHPPPPFSRTLTGLVTLAEH